VAFDYALHQNDALFMSDRSAQQGYQGIRSAIQAGVAVFNVESISG
jgi:hypothetical protein